MPAVTIITDTSGTDWVLDGTNGMWEGRGKKGFHAPQYAHFRDESPNIAGAFWRGVRTLPRELFLPIVIRDPNRDNVLARRRELISALDPLKGECTLTSAWPDGSARSIKARYVDGMDAGEQGPGEYGITVIRYGLRFIADDPYMFGDTISQEWSVTTASRTELPMPGVDGNYEVVSSPLLVSLTPGPIMNANPTFDSGLAPWFGIGGTASHNVTTVFEGTGSGRLIPSGVDANVRMESDWVAVVPNSPVMTSGMLRSDTARQVALNVNWFNSSSGYISTYVEQKAVAANTWTPFASTFYAPANAAFVNLAATIPASSVPADILYVDSATIRIGQGVTTVNPGDVPTYPSWELKGPFTSVDITNATTGKTVTLAYNASATGKLFVVTDPANTYLVDEAGNNRWDTLQSGFSLWPLVSGVNNVIVNMQGAAAGTSAKLTFQPLYNGD